MNALTFVHKLWTDHEPLLREELFSSVPQSSRMRKAPSTGRAEPSLNTVQRMLPAVEELPPETV